MNTATIRRTTWRAAPWVRIAAACFLAGRAFAADAPAPGKPASIPFASRNVYNWQADGEKGIWVQDNGRRWYYGTFDFPCRGLDFRMAVRILAGPTDELDRWGGIQTRDSGKCRFKSFETSLGPPQPAKQDKHAPATAPAASVPAAPAQGS